MVMCQTLFVITVASQEEFLMTFLFLWFVMWSPDNALVLCMLLKKSWCSMFIFRTMLSRITTSSLNAARGFSTSVARWEGILNVEFILIFAQARRRRAACPWGQSAILHQQQVYISEYRQHFDVFSQLRYKLTAYFIVFFGSGLTIPFFAMRHQLLKK